ncbi:MAG: sigma 54-interacting transcriptional regulator [Acidobacteriota bacterium]
MNIVFLAPPSADRADIVGLLNDAGHVAVVVETAAQVGTRGAQVGVDLILLDLASGAESLRFLRKRGQRALPVVCVADRRQPEVSSEALRLGIADVVSRPVRGGDLTTALSNGREFARLAERGSAGAEAQEPEDGVYGASPAMREVLGIVRRVAQSRCGVLIVGERGTGRETIARAVHFHGPRRDRPFIKFRCAEINPAEFIDTVEGSAGHDVTLFLEDVGELPAELQASLELRLSAQAAVAGIAATDLPAMTPAEMPDAHAATLRVIGSAEPRITEWVERGLVRRTLIDLIAIVRIDLPPLRQRVEDVPLLATHFLKDACRRNGMELKAFSRSALTLLASLPWPGNGSELRALAERLAVLVPRGTVLLEDVLASVRLDGAEAITRERGSLRNAREQFEREHVTAVLQHHKGRMGAAARELGIERTNLYRKIKHLHIQWTVPD